MAELTGAAQRHARWRPLTESETADAVAELQEIAGHRADLLSEVAGILLGACEGALDEPRAKSAAQVCRRVGADETLIPRWMEKGSAVLRSPAGCRSQAACADRVLLPSGQRRGGPDDRPDRFRLSACPALAGSRAQLVRSQLVHGAEMAVASASRSYGSIT